MKKLLALLLALVLCLGLSAPALAAETSFSDVPPSHWAYQAIRSAAEAGIISGQADGSFRPSGSATNAQFAVMLSRAFYPQDVDAYKDPDGFKSWYWPNLKALLDRGILAGTAIARENDWHNTAGDNITRYDMAQLMYNLMTLKGKTVNSYQRAQASTQITDWANVPYRYRSAVSTCYALGILGGRADGSFSGWQTMNRAQGCVVIQRMLEQIDPNVAPEPVPQEQPVTVSSRVDPIAAGVTTGWAIRDNGFPSGTLNNGMGITETTVSAMLAQAKEIWYDGMPWGSTALGDNNYYDMYAYDGTMTQGGSLVSGRGINATTSSGGFAAMLSDYVFGLYSNEARKLADNTHVRPGDIIFQMANGKLIHVKVALSTVQYDEGYPCVAVCDGNINGMISWEDPSDRRSGRVDSYAREDGAYITCAIYTRYPE